MRLERVIVVPWIAWLVLTTGACEQILGLDTPYPAEPASPCVGDECPDSAEAICGDDEVADTEQCDTGAVDTATCDEDCTAVQCGDGHVNAAAGEQCDPPDGADCTASCRTAVIRNGGFETGDYAGWSLEESSADPQAGAWTIGTAGLTITSADNVFDFNDGVTVPAECLLATSDIAVTTLDGSDRVAMQISFSNENHRMYQDITLPADATILRWDMAYQSSELFDAAGQYLGVHIRDASSNAIVRTLFITRAGAEPRFQPMASFMADIGEFAGETIRIDVELETRFCFDAIFDNFRVE